MKKNELEQSLDRLVKTVDSLSEAHRKTEEAQRKTEETMNKLAEAQRETRAVAQETDRKIGWLGNSLGDVAEDLFGRALEPLMRQRGIILDRVKYRVNPMDGHEFDIVGVNGKVAVIVEVKHKLKQSDVEDFLALHIAVFRQEHPKYARHMIIGVVAGSIVSREVERFAEKKGLYVLTQNGEGGACIVNAPGFKVKYW